MWRLVFLGLFEMFWKARFRLLMVLFVFLLFISLLNSLVRSHCSLFFPEFGSLCDQVEAIEEYQTWR